MSFKHTLSDDTQEEVELQGHKIWRPTLSEPYWVGLGLKRAKCGCGKVFRDKQGYVEHYIYMAVWQNESGYIPKLLTKAVQSGVLVQHGVLK